MTKEDFIAKHPLLYHMATAASEFQIRKYGLISSEMICDLLEVEAVLKDQLLSYRRPDLVTLSTPENGSFTLRDQKPMLDSKLSECLVDMSLTQWYRLLNSRVFMWANKERVETLLNARAYRKADQLVLTIDSRLLLDVHYKDVTVSTINSGATFYVPVKRGASTFVPLSQFPTDKNAKPIVELTVAPGVPDMAKFIISSEIRKAQ